MVIACYGARAVDSHYASLELLVSLMRQIASASIRRGCQKLVLDGELLKNAFNLGRKQTMTLLSALWNELEYLGMPLLTVKYITAYPKRETQVEET